MRPGSLATIGSDMKGGYPAEQRPARHEKTRSVANRGARERRLFQDSELGLARGER